MVMSPSNSSILHGLCTFGIKIEKGIRSTFFPTSPRPVFASWIFSQLLRDYGFFFFILTKEIFRC